MKSISQLSINKENKMNRQNLLSTSREILIADAGVEDLGTLLDGLNSGVEAWLVQPGEDAVGQIIKALATPGLKTLHLLAHGAPGQINLGGRAVTAADFRSRFDGAAERDLDIAFWSCHTGAGDAGQSFVQAVAEVTGARVAAADGLVGNAEKGGCWGLNVTAPFSADAQRSFAGVLAVVTGTALELLTNTGGFTWVDGVDVPTLTATANAAADLIALDAAAATSIIDAALVTSLTGTAAQLNTVLVTNAATTTGLGAKDVTISDAASVIALNAIDAATTGVITASITGTATALAALTGTNNAYTLTVTGGASIAQLAALDAITTGSITADFSDTAANLLDAFASGAITGNANVTVSGAASLAQMAALNAATTGTLNAGVNANITDTAANLASAAGVATAGAVTYVVAGTNVTVTDAATIAQIAKIDALNGGGTLTYAAGIADTLANLTANKGLYVANTRPTTVTDAASIAQLTTLDALANVGTVTANIVADTLANLTANTTYVTAGHAVTVTDAASIAQLTTLDALAKVGTVTANIVADTLANLTTNTGGYVIAGKAVTVTDAASLADLATLDALGNVGTVTANIVADTLANLTTNTGGYVIAGKAVTVTDAASLADLATLDAKANVGTVTANIVADTLAKLNTDSALNAGAGKYVVAGKAVTVTDAVSIAQLATLDAKTNVGTVTANIVADTYANLVANVGGYVTAGHIVRVTDTVTLDQLATLAALANVGTATAATISETADNLAPSGVASDVIASGTNVTVTGAATIAQLVAIDTANGAGTLTSTAATIADVAANLATTTAAGVTSLTAGAKTFVTAARSVTVTDAATLAQLKAIDTANTTGTLTYTAIKGVGADFATTTAVGVTSLTANATTYVNGSTDLVVTNATIAQLAAIDAANGGAALNYSVSDTYANLHANVGGYVFYGTDLTVTDAATLAQLAELDATNGGATPTYTTVKDTAVNLAANTDGYIFEGINVVVIDTAKTDKAATIAQLTAVDAANGSGTLTYTAVADALAYLTADAGTYVLASKAVTVTDAASIAQLATLDALKNVGAVTANVVADTLANLTKNTGGYVVKDKAVIVTDKASIADLAKLDALANVGAVTANAISDTAAKLASTAGVLTDGAATYVKAGNSVTFTSTSANTNVSDLVVSVAGTDTVAAPDALTVTPTQGRAAATETGTVTFSSLAAGQSVTVAGQTLTATAAITAEQVATAFSGGVLPDCTFTGTLAGWTTGGLSDASVTYTSNTANTNVSDLTVTVGGTAKPTAPTVVTVQGASAATETGTIIFGSLIAGQSVTVGGKTLTAPHEMTAEQVADAFGGNSPANFGGTNFVGWTVAGVVGTSVTVTDAATLAQLRAIADGGGTLTFTTITDTAAHFADATGVVVTSDTDVFLSINSAATVTVTDAATIAQLNAINGFLDPGNVATYTALTGLAADLATNADGYVRAGKAVTVEDAATIAQLHTIDVANGGGALAYTAVHDLVATLVANAGGYVNTGGLAALGKDVTVDNAATVAQMVTIDTANGNGTLTYDIADTAAHIATALATGNAGLVEVQKASTVDASDNTLTLTNSQFANLIAGTSVLDASDTVVVNDVAGNLGTLSNYGGNGTLTLGGAANGAVTVNTGTSGVDTIHLGGTGNHVVTAAAAVATVILDAAQNGGSTIAGLLAGDDINIDGGAAITDMAVAAEASAGVVNAATKWFFNTGTGVLTYYNDVHSAAETVTLTGVTALTHVGDLFTVA